MPIIQRKPCATNRHAIVIAAILYFMFIFVSSCIYWGVQYLWAILSLGLCMSTLPAHKYFLLRYWLEVAISIHCHCRFFVSWKLLTIHHPSRLKERGSLSFFLWYRNEISALGRWKPLVFNQLPSSSRDSFLFSYVRMSSLERPNDFMVRYWTLVDLG